MQEWQSHKQIGHGSTQMGGPYFLLILWVSRPLREGNKFKLLCGSICKNTAPTSPSRIMCISPRQVNGVIRNPSRCIPCRQQSISNISGLFKEDFVP
uniref:Alpha-1 2-Mannosidase n=1 Tax=Rhizophora mucronata TaxID=61149 RepID=A0A2P2LW10_RHIMU